MKFQIKNWSNFCSWNRKWNIFVCIHFYMWSNISDWYKSLIDLVRIKIKQMFFSFEIPSQSESIHLYTNLHKHKYITWSTILKQTPPFEHNYKIHLTNSKVVLKNLLFSNQTHSCNTIMYLLFKINTLYFITFLEIVF